MIENRFFFKRLQNALLLIWESDTINLNVRLATEQRDDRAPGRSGRQPLYFSANKAAEL